MRFRVEHGALTDAVAWAARVLPARPAAQLQVCAGLLLDASGPAPTVAAFDYEVAARCDLDATVTETGRALVPGRLLADIAKSLPAAPVDVHTDGTHVVIACGNARFTVPAMPDRDYPTLPPMPPVTGHLDGTAFATAAAQVAIAAGRDDTLPVLTGVRVEIDGGTLTLAATDRYRLAVRALPWHPAAADASGAALVPARTLLETAKSLAGVDVAVALGAGPSGEALAGFAGGTRRTTTRLIDGQFPPYRKLLPDSSPLTAQLAVAPLAEAVRRVALVAPRTAPVHLTFTPGHLALDAGAGSEAQASEHLPATYSGPELAVAFNPSYLLDALGALGSDAVQIGFASADDPATAAAKPAILTGTAADEDDIPDYRYLLMPIRLTG